MFPSTNILYSDSDFQIGCRLKAELYGDSWHATDRIVTSRDGKEVFPDSLTRWFSKFVEKNDLPKISLHNLRHTNTTNSQIYEKQSQQQLPLQ